MHSLSFWVHKKKLHELSAAITREYQNVPQQIIQNASDGKIERHWKCHNAGDHSLPDEYFPFKMSVISVKYL